MTELSSLGESFLQNRTLKIYFLEISSKKKKNRFSLVLGIPMRKCNTKFSKHIIMSRSGTIPSF